MILALVVFVSDALIGYLYGKHFDARQQHERKKVLAFNALLDLAIGVNAMGFVTQGWPMLIPSIAGSFVGTWWSLR